jgi:hypothetical protein
MPQTAVLDVQGYTQCSNCPELHPKILLWRLGGVCPECIDAGIRPLRHLEVEIEGRTALVKLRHRHSGSRGSKSTSKQAEKARLAAQRRLAVLFPDLFDAILAEERAIRCLEPWYVTAEGRKLDFEELQRTVAALLATYGPSTA